MNFWHNANPERIRCCIRVRWPPNQIHNLIKLYRDNPCLWNKGDPLYLDYCARRAAYRSIFEQIKDRVPNVNLIEVIVKLREVRKFYVIDLRKIADGSIDESRFTWFDEINEFLRPHLHVDEYSELEAASTYSSNYCDETPSPRSRTGLSDACLSSDTPTKNSQMRLDLLIPSTSTQLIKSTNSQLTARKSCDRLDLFAKGVACRLRRMSAEVAAVAQIEIQQLLTDFEDTAACQSNISDADTRSQDCICEVIMPFSGERRFMSQESRTNYTV